MKNLKSFLYISFVFMALTFLSGCIITGIKKGNQSSVTPIVIEDFSKNEDLSPEIANKILDRTLEGIKENSYKDFAYRFTQDLRKQISEDEFIKMQKSLSGSLGEFENREYLGYLQKGPLMIYLWKGKFSKAKNNDLVIRLTVGKLDEAVQVFAFEISNR